jgi:hypothetical protein
MATGIARPANLINHIGFVLDASSSMSGRRGELVRVADGLVKHLAGRSTEMGQETRVSVWTFADKHRIDCVVWDMDVLRLPSIADLYQVGGMTALIDATLVSVRDLDEIPQRHGDHSYLVYALTDGQENASSARPQDLASRISGLPGNWTLAALVPDLQGVHEAKRAGFPAGNVERWDTTSTRGVAEVGETIRRATDNYMTGRASGIRSTRTLFSTGADAVNAQTIRAAGLTSLRNGAYGVFEVTKDASIRDFVESLGMSYVTGRAYYEHSKAETIQPQKVLAFQSKVDGRVFTGPEARQMVGLPDMHVKVRPDHNPDYRIYVQSTSTNRRLKAGTKLLYML